MKKSPIKVYQKLAFSTWLISFCKPAMASNFTALPAVLTIWVGLPTLLIGSLILFLISRNDITKVKKVVGFITVCLVILFNLPLIYLDSPSGYKIVHVISTTGECFYETELSLCKEILWVYGFYVLIILVFFYCIYHFIKKAYPPKLPLLKDMNNNDI